MKNFKKRKLNEASKKASKKTGDRRKKDLGGPKKPRKSGRIRSTDPGEPGYEDTEEEMRREEEEARDDWADLERQREGSSTEYHRLGYVLAEALRVEDEEPKSSNAYVRALNTIKEDSRIGGRYGSGPGSRPVGGWTPDAPWPKKKPEGTEETEETEETTATTPKPTKKKKKKKKGSR